MEKKIFLLPKTILAIVIMVLVAACGQTTKTEREGEPDIYSVTDDDAGMNEAIKKSRQTFDNFLNTLRNRKDNQSDFSVKMPFATEFGGEHIWLVDVEEREGKLFGQIDNVPESVTEVQLGDTVEIVKDKISDWFYVEDNKLIGGLTIRLLRDRMSPEERKQFDEEYGLELE